MTNISKRYVCYKVSANVRGIYDINPRYGFLTPGTFLIVEVRTIPFENIKSDTANHKITVTSTLAPEGTPVMDSAQCDNIWQNSVDSFDCCLHCIFCVESESLMCLPEFVISRLTTKALKKMTSKDLQTLIRSRRSAIDEVSNKEEDKTVDVDSRKRQNSETEETHDAGASKKPKLSELIENPSVPTRDEFEQLVSELRAAKEENVTLKAQIKKLESLKQLNDFDSTLTQQRDNFHQSVLEINRYSREQPVAYSEELFTEVQSANMAFENIKTAVNETNCTSDVREMVRSLKQNDSTPGNTMCQSCPPERESREEHSK